MYDALIRTASSYPAQGQEADASGKMEHVSISLLIMSMPCLDTFGGLSLPPCVVVVDARVASLAHLAEGARWRNASFDLVTAPSCCSFNTTDLPSTNKHRQDEVLRARVSGSGRARHGAGQADPGEWRIRQARQCQRASERALFPGAGQVKDGEHAQLTRD